MLKLGDCCELEVNLTTDELNFCDFHSLLELFYDRGNHHEFTSLVKELVKPGEMTTNGSYKFEFVNVEKPYESYTGKDVRLRLVVYSCVYSFIHSFIIYLPKIKLEN